MLARVLISVDGTYAPVSISESAAWLVRLPTWRDAAINSPSGGRGVQSAQLCQAESRPHADLINEWRPIASLGPSDFKVAAWLLLR